MEQDLHITSELQIEVSESEFDDKNIPDFVARELKTCLNPYRSQLRNRFLIELEKLQTRDRRA